jgi:very-short-patch-repair endonuclease
MRSQLREAGWSEVSIGHAQRHWQTVLPGIYLVDDRARDIEVRATAALLRWPDALLSDVTAARFLGYSIVDPLPDWPLLVEHDKRFSADDVHVICERQLRAPPGFVARQGSPGPAVFVRDVRVTEPIKTLLDVARTAPLPIAVPMIDAVLHESPWLMPELAELANRLSGHRNIARAQRAIHLASWAAESVLESLLRLLIILAGLPPPQLQIPIRHPRGTYFADMGYRDKRLIIEADGRDHHSEWQKVAEDMVRHNFMVAAGWRVLRFTWAQIMFQPEMVIAAIRAALALPIDH